MDTSRKIHYAILAGILIIAIIGAAITGKQTPTGMTSLGVVHDYPYYLNQPAHTNRPAIEKQTAGGMPTNPERAPARSYKLEPVDYIRNFFGTTMVFFPEYDPCAYAMLKYVRRLDAINSDRIELFSSGEGNHKFMTMIFEEEDKSMGKLTLIRGFDDPNRCLLLYDITKTVIGISSWQKTMTLQVEAEGIHTGQSIHVIRGKVSVPGFGFECTFG
ncbi:hypothetical protein KY346_04710 [Candidatus Woesearchaeota archaeon]|nr:hypothetical protein [Candidatus Woesearchaeota archaeon]